MVLQLLIPMGRDKARPEPVPGTLYRCAAAWRICPFCAHPTGDAPPENRCRGCLMLLPAEPVMGSCSMYGVVEVRDPKGGFHGLLCQGHTSALMARIAGSKLGVKADSIEDMVEARLYALSTFPAEHACTCLPGENRTGPNEIGDVLCEACGRLMVASTIAHLTELLAELREAERPREAAHE